MAMSSCRIVVALLSLSFSAFTGVTEQGRGMNFGTDFAYYASAPAGWVLDNESGAQQGLFMVFYPVGYTWKESPAVVYGNSVRKSEVATIEDQVKRTVADFQAAGSPDYHAMGDTLIDLASGRNGSLFLFSGDKWGNHEAVVYIEERDVINFLVLSARSEESFNQYIGDFLQIADSYEDAALFGVMIDQKGVDSLRNLVFQQTTSEDGKAYQDSAVDIAGQQMMDFMKDCISYCDEADITDFSLFMRVDSLGMVLESAVYPRSALSICFGGLMRTVKFPPHRFGSFLLDFNMKIKQ